MIGPARFAKILVLTAAPTFATALADAPLTAQNSTIQDSAAFPRGTWSFGGSLGLPWSPTEFELLAFTVGAHLTRVPVHTVGLDIAIGTLPILLSGIPNLGARAALAFMANTPSALLFPSVGVSYTTATYLERTEAAIGVHVGATAIVRRGIRVGVTAHWLYRQPTLLFEVGYQPPRRPAGPGA